MGSVHDDTLWYAQEASRRERETGLPDELRLAFEYLRTDIIEATGNVGGQRDRLLNSIERLRSLTISALARGNAG
jgi:hypothetical protein